MASPSSSSRAGNVHGIQFDGDDDYIHYELETCVATLAQLFLDPNDPKKYKGPMPHHIDALLQLASGLEYIHSQNLVHGDIKPENVLISVGSGGKDEIILKWANIGLTRDVSERGRGKTNQVGGNNAWLSPELQSTREHKRDVEKNNYKETAKSDVFAQGLVFGCLFLNGEHLYGSMENKNEIPQNIIEGNPINMQKMDRTLKDCYEDKIFKKMLEYDPNKRMTSTEVVNQLKSIKDKLTGKEKELLQLCAGDSRLDLTEKIQTIIGFGINVNAKDHDGSNVLHLLCRHYSSPKLTDAMKLVIRSGINVNAKDYNGLNALHYLCRHNSTSNLLDAVQTLLQSGIDANAKTNDGSNALHYLSRYNSKSNFRNVVGIFLKLGIDLMATDDNGWNMFYYLFPESEEKSNIWFDRYDLLGNGSYGSVFKGKYAGREVAVKRVQIHHVKELEEEAIKKLSHPNVVKLFHCESDADFRVYALELCDASLDQLFLKLDDPKKYNGPMPRHFEVLVQLALGLEHIHSKDLIHRDIKPNNVLISKTTTIQGVEVTIKLADFGLSKQVNEGGTFTLSGVRGNRQWLAPEILRRILQADNDERGNVKSDVFALALVFGYYFLKGEHLYGSSEKEIQDNIKGKKTINMEKIDGELREIYENDLFLKMLEDEPSKRMTSKEVVLQLLESIKDKLAAKEQELRHLCAAPDSQSDLTENIKKMIRFGIDLNAKDKNGFNALHLLCQYNSSEHLVDAIKVLMELGIDKDARTNAGWTALHLLCANNSSQHLVDAIKVLIELGIDKDAKTKNGSTALHLLCRFNSSRHLVDAIKVLIELGIDKDAKDEDGRNALHHLCSNNKSPQLIEAIKVLIELGIDKDAKEEDGWNNALHLLCANSSSPHLIEAIQELIKLGIDKDAKTGKGWNALHFLCSNSSSPHLIEAIQELIELGIDKDAKNNDGRNALHLLCQSHSSSNLIKEIKRLIELGYKVNDKDKDGRNALHYLCQDNSSSNLVEAIKLFVENRIDMNAKDNAEWNVLHYLCRFNSSSDLRDVIQILIQHGIDVKEKTDDGCNAVHFLCQNHSTSNLIGAIQILIQHGINVNEKNNNGWNALYFFIRNSSMDKLLKANVFRFLIRHGIQVHCENEESSNLYQDFFKENDNWGKTCFDFLVKEEIRLGWHDACKNCQQILSITESPRVRLQHHQMFSGCYGVFHLLMKHLEQWAKSNQRPGESELDMSNPTKWLREKAEQYPESETEKSFREDFEFMADVSEQVKKGSNSSEFNCDKYERYLKSMYSIAEMIVSNESMGQIKWFYLLPFDFPIDYGNEKESDIKRAKIEWDKTLFSWTHTETDEDYGTFMKEDANDGFFLPKEFKHKCHGGT